MWAEPGLTVEELVNLADDALYIVIRCEGEALKEFDFAESRVQAFRIQEMMEMWPGEVSLLSREDA